MQTERLRSLENEVKRIQETIASYATGPSSWMWLRTSFGATSRGPFAISRTHLPQAKTPKMLSAPRRR